MIIRWPRSIQMKRTHLFTTSNKTESISALPCLTSLTPTPPRPLRPRTSLSPALSSTTSTTLKKAVTIPSCIQSKKTKVSSGEWPPQTETWPSSQSLSKRKDSWYHPLPKIRQLMPWSAQIRKAAASGNCAWTRNLTGLHSIGPRWTAMRWQTSSRETWSRFRICTKASKRWELRLRDNRPPRDWLSRQALPIPHSLAANWPKMVPIKVWLSICKCLELNAKACQITQQPWRYLSNKRASTVAPSTSNIFSNRKRYRLWDWAAHVYSKLITTTMQPLNCHLDAYPRFTKITVQITMIHCKKSGT